MRFRKSRDVAGVIKRATISRKASGWYISILGESEVADPLVQPVTAERTLGIDLGLKDFLVASTGARQPAPQFLRNAEKKLAKAQRALVRAQRGSRRYQKLRHNVARLHEHVANARQDFLHKLSTTLMGETQAIMAERLNVQGLGRTRLAKSVPDAGWGEFLRQLPYKCAAQGKTFHQIDRFFPSTKLHAPCNTLNELSLAERTFVCQGCGAIVDRDLNAAQNIKQRGLFEVLWVPSGYGQSDSLTARRLDVTPASAGRLE